MPPPLPTFLALLLFGCDSRLHSAVERSSPLSPSPGLRMLDERTNCENRCRSRGFAFGLGPPLRRRERRQRPSFIRTITSYYNYYFSMSATLPRTPPPRASVPISSSSPCCCRLRGGSKDEVDRFARCSFNDDVHPAFRESHEQRREQVLKELGVDKDEGAEGGSDSDEPKTVSFNTTLFGKLRAATNNEVDLLLNSGSKTIAGETLVDRPFPPRGAYWDEIIGREEGLQWKELERAKNATRQQQQDQTEYTYRLSDDGSEDFKVHHLQKGVMDAQRDLQTLRINGENEFVNMHGSKFGAPPRFHPAIPPPPQGHPSPNGRNRVRDMAKWDMVVTFAGGNRNNRTDPVDGLATDANLQSFSTIAYDGRGGILVADTECRRIRRVDTVNGEVTTIAGRRLPFPLWHGMNIKQFQDGRGTNAIFGEYFCITADLWDGSAIVSDTHNQRIRRVQPDGEVTTIAGRGAVGKRDGTPTRATFNHPAGVGWDPTTGNIFVADSTNNVLRKIIRLPGPSKGGFAAQEVVTVAGSATAKRKVERKRLEQFPFRLKRALGEPDGKGSAALFWLPSPLAVDGHGNVYMGELQRYSIRKITPSGETTTVVCQESFTGPMFDTAPVHHKRLISSQYRGRNFGITTDAASNVYWTDKFASVIRKITPMGSISLHVGIRNERGCVDGLPLAAVLNCPSALAFAPSQKEEEPPQLYIADNWEFKLKRIEKRPYSDPGFIRHIRDRRPEWLKWDEDEIPFDPDKLSADRFATYMRMHKTQLEVKESMESRERQLARGVDLNENVLREPGILSFEQIARKGLKYYLDHADDEIKAARAAGKKPPKYGYTPPMKASNWEPRVIYDTSEESESSMPSDDFGGDNGGKEDEKGAGAIKQPRIRKKNRQGRGDRLQGHDDEQDLF
mmetsp:Transcript_5975/g.9285  ORF Transcript_5975/g.9285 Transcript_5975/m.9285 type:complete len:904 (+) Transcript_5975:141-2852(+)